MVKKFLNDLKKKFEISSEDMLDEESAYVELSARGTPRRSDSRVIVRPFVLEDFSDIKPIVDSLRQGYTIALVNIAPLKEKDLVELKRAVNKLKKTVDALDGDIAGVSDDFIVAVPGFAEVYRSGPEKDLEE